MFVGITLVCLTWMAFCMFGLTTADGFPEALSWVHQFCSVRNENNSITGSQNSRAGIPSMRKTASRECEGSVDVIGVVTPLVRGSALVVLHGDQVVELSVMLGMHEKREVEEDGESQIEIEWDENEVKENRSCMTMNVDEMKTQEHLEP